MIGKYTYEWKSEWLVGGRGMVGGWMGEEVDDGEEHLLPQRAVGEVGLLRQEKDASLAMHHCPLDAACGHLASVLHHSPHHTTPHFTLPRHTSPHPTTPHHTTLHHTTPPLQTGQRPSRVRRREVLPTPESPVTMMLTPLSTCKLKSAGIVQW